MIHPLECVSLLGQHRNRLHLLVIATMLGRLASGRPQSLQPQRFYGKIDSKGRLFWDDLVPGNFKNVA